MISTRPMAGERAYLAGMHGAGMHGAGSLGAVSLIDESNQNLASEVVSQGLDKFIRQTEGGKEVLQQISVYAMLPYAILGFGLGWLIGRR